jgi:hypothetical protein
MRPLIASLALLPLAACQIAQSNATATDPAPGTCNGATLGQFAGQPASEELGARILKASGARTIRWVPKGSVITMEYNSQRVTVMLDEANKVEHASCG